MKIFLNKQSRALIIIMSALALLAIVVSKVYYTRVNNAVDPRIKPARELYKKYNRYAQSNAFDSVFYLMDTIEYIYSNIEHYSYSYETGVLYNNRSAAYLTMALHNKKQYNVDSLFSLAHKNVNTAIDIYSRWLQKYQDDNTPLSELVKTDFYINDTYNQLNEKHVKQRVEEITEAIDETGRRLSVAYTNLGIVYRNNMQYDSAALCYKKALNLWERNLTAENNLNTLLGREQRKRSFIQKMFPPAR